MRIYPAVHYTMGGLWVDYNLMSNIPGLFVLGEANFSDHGANRLGASALMQGLADGYFVIPYTIGDYLASQKPGSRPSVDAPEFRAAEENVTAMTTRLLANQGKQPVSHFHKRLGFFGQSLLFRRALRGVGIKSLSMSRRKFFLFHQSDLLSNRSIQRFDLFFDGRDFQL